MAIRRDQLSLQDQYKYEMISEADKATVDNYMRNCKSIEEVSSLLGEMKACVHASLTSYEPKLQVSGSSVKYKTKNLFTEIFEEEDVKDFIALAEMSSTMEDEVVGGELKRKISSMQKEGKQPLQCLVYATKQNEKVFYNNEKKVAVWAQVIADTVDDSTDYDVSINHMLVNWGMWKYQITMLITACGFMKQQNERLDEVIRDLYTDYDDDKVRYTVMKRLLRGLNEANYQCAFTMLKKANFIASDIDRKYFGALRRTVENATVEEREALYAVFRGTQGFSGAKRLRVESLFDKKEETGIAKKINESSVDQKETILKMVHGKVYGTQRDYREIAKQAKDIRQYRTEIQEMFMNKLEKTIVGYEDIKVYGLAIGDLDQEGRAIPFLEEQMSLYDDIDKQLMFAYVLAVLSDQHIDGYIDKVLKYDGNRAQSVLFSVKKLMRSGKNPVVRQYLYTNCLKIKEEKGIDSRELETALRNIGIYLQGGSTVAIYDVKFDQMLFEFIGYNKAEGSFDKSKCTARNATIVLGILENVMDKNNYEGRYMKFMWDLFAYFRNANPDLANRIDDAVKDLTGQGIPYM